MIKALRKKAKLSQLELANKMGVDRSTVSKWETEGTLPRNGVDLLKLAKILKTTVDKLIKNQMEVRA